jgi:hypothetical protein
MPSKRFGQGQQVIVIGIGGSLLARQRIDVLGNDNRWRCIQTPSLMESSLFEGEESFLPGWRFAENNVVRRGCARNLRKLIELAPLDTYGTDS